MKKLTLVLLVVASLILGAFTLASCEMPTEIAGIAIPEIELPFDVPFINTECEHQYVEEVVKAATCTEEGAKTLTCSKCGEIAEEVIPALGHDFATKFTTDKAATCSAEGSKSKHCSRCDATTEVTVIEKDEHVWKETLTVDVVKTCLVNGESSYHCEICDARDEDHLVIDYAVGDHTWGLVPTVDIPKTCTTDGSQSIHCQVCDETKDKEVLPAGHVWNADYEIDQDFTCDKDGQKSIHCSACDAVKDKVVLPAHHVLGDDATVTKPASLFVKGVRTGTCVNCSTTQSEDVNADIFVIDGSNKPTSLGIGSIEGDTEYVYKKALLDMVDDKNKYYPTADDADGKAAIMEISILLNETLDYAATGKSCFVLRVQRQSTKTNLCSIDFIGDDFTDAFGTWITGDTQTGYNGPTKVVEGATKQAASRMEAGWHRFGFKLRQVVVAKDAGGAVIELVNGQLPENSDKVIESLTYKWILEYYVDGVLVKTGYYEGLSKGNNQAGIWDEANLLYTAAKSEDGKKIIYTDAVNAENDEKKVYFRLSMANAYANNSSVRTAVADAYVTIGDDFVQKITTATFNTNGGTPVNTLKYDGCDYSFPNIAYYTVNGADPTTFQFEKRGFKQTGADEFGNPIWALEDNHTEHFSANPTIIYKATIFSEGLETYTCDACGKTGVIEVLPKTQISNINYAAYCKKDNQGPANVDNCVDFFKQGSAIISYNKDYMVEVSFLYNESMKDAEGDTLPNLRFKNASGKFLTINTKTGQLAFVSGAIQNEDIQNGISNPVVNLAYGWHRIGVQIRPYAKIVEDEIVYGCAFRLYVDGELMNNAGTWTEATASFASTYKFFNASVEEGQIKYGSEVRNDILWRYGDFRTANNYGALIFDNVCYNGVARTITDTGVYADMFELDVTPLDATRAYAKGKKLVLDANGGSFSTKTFAGTYKAYDEEEGKNYTADYDYVLTNTVWFQIDGAAAMPVPTPTNYGALFIGWEKVETEDTITYIAQWTAIHNHNFVEDMDQHVDATCLEGKKVSYCTICGVEKVEAIPSVGAHHYEVNTEESYAPKCGVAGATIEYCSLCHDKKTTPITALTHKYTLNTTESYAPDCTNAGANISYCDYCQDKKTDVIPALGHDYSEHTGLTKVFALSTTQEMNDAVQAGKLTVNSPEGSYTGIKDGDYITNKGTKSKSLSCSDIITFSYDSDNANYNIFTFSIAKEQDNNGKYWICFNNGNGCYLDFLYVCADGIYAVDKGDNGTTKISGWKGETYIKISVVLDRVTNSVLYYVNGKLAATETGFTVGATSGQTITSFNSVRIQRAMTQNGCYVNFKDFSLYSGSELVCDREN